MKRGTCCFPLPYSLILFLKCFQCAYACLASSKNRKAGEDRVRFPLAFFSGTKPNSNKIRSFPDIFWNHKRTKFTLHPYDSLAEQIRHVWMDHKCFFLTVTEQVHLFNLYWRAIKHITIFDCDSHLPFVRGVYIWKEGVESCKRAQKTKW